MQPKKLSIVTTTFNCVEQINAYLASFASLDASQLSIMPTGFESLPSDDLKALLEYLCQPHR